MHKASVLHMNIIHPRFCYKTRRDATIFAVVFPPTFDLTVSTMYSALCLVLAAFVALGAHAQPVNQPPVLQEAPQEVLFRENKAFELDCVVEGDANKIQFSWNKDDKPYKPTGKVEQREGKLVFSEPKASDEGVYQCFATTPQGKATARPTSVKRAYLVAPKVTPQTIKPVEGKPFKLACALPDAYPKPTIEWVKKTKDGKTSPVSDGRITIAPEGDLYFANATEGDVSKDFKYVCIAKSPAVDGEVPLAEHTVEPLTPNPKPDNEVVQQYVTPDKFVLEAGKQAYLFCIYGGSPFPHPDWYKDGKNVNGNGKDRVTRYNRSKGKRLLIREVLLEDQGEYTCVLNNEIGKEQKYVFNVEVVSAPKFVKKPEKRIQAKEGSDVTIPCEVQAKPATKGAFTFNGAALSNTRAQPSAQGLTISKVQKGDSGYYGCGAENEHGEDYVETLVQVV